MRRKDDSKKLQLMEFINDYIGRHSTSPSVREISSGTGIPHATVQRYLVAMDEDGELEYDGKRIGTAAAQKMTPVNCMRVLGRVACGPGDEEQEEVLEYIRMLENLVGKKVLVRAQCKDIRFHDLRHTFATTALEHGMDVKTLSAIIGHISSATTIDIYSHITGAMQQQAAQKIERGIGHSEAYEPHETLGDQLPAEDGKPPVSPPFAPYKGKVRKPGTGGIYELNDHLFEGRYSPTNAQGKREVHTVYAKTKEECEALLEQMITEVRERIKEEKRRMKETGAAQ